MYLWRVIDQVTSHPRGRGEDSTLLAKGDRLRWRGRDGTSLSAGQAPAVRTSGALHKGRGGAMASTQEVEHLPDERCPDCGSGFARDLKGIGYRRHLARLPKHDARGAI